MTLCSVAWEENSRGLLPLFRLSEDRSDFDPWTSVCKTHTPCIRCCLSLKQTHLKKKNVQCALALPDLMKGDRKMSWKGEERSEGEWREKTRKNDKWLHNEKYIYRSYWFSPRSALWPASCSKHALPVVAQRHANLWTFVSIHLNLWPSSFIDWIKLQNLFGFTAWNWHATQSGVDTKPHPVGGGCSWRWAELHLISSFLNPKELQHSPVFLKSCWGYRFFFYRNTLLFMNQCFKLM